MATAAMTPRINSAQVLGPGVAEAKSERDPVLPSQQLAGELFPPSNVSVELIITEHLPSARPAHVLLGALGDPRLQVVKPITLDVSVEETHVIVSWAEADEFGTGETLSVAIDDFSGAVRELHRQLFAPDAKLGSDMLRIKQTLQQYIQLRK